MQNHTASLTRALDARGIAQDVLTARPPGAPRRQRIGRRSTVRRFGVPVHVARQGWAAFAAPSALRLAAGADLVHAHVGEDLAVLPLAAAAARLQGRPLVVTVHTSLRHTYTAEGPRSAVLKAVGGQIEAATTRRADRVIAL